MLGEGISQLYVFLVFFAVGVVLTVPYLFVLGFLKSKLANVIFDAIYGAGAVFAVWKINVAVNNGECRVFVFLGLLLGVLIVATTCKTPLDKCSAKLYNLTTSKKAVNEHGTTILQKENGNSGNSAGGSAGVSGVPVASDADPTDKPKSRKKQPKTNGKRRRKRRRSQK